LRFAQKYDEEYQGQFDPKTHLSHRYQYCRENIFKSPSWSAGLQGTVISSLYPPGALFPAAFFLWLLRLLAGALEFLDFSDGGMGAVLLMDSNYSSLVQSDDETFRLHCFPVSVLEEADLPMGGFSAG
jgi:hypothetical protein